MTLNRTLEPGRGWEPCKVCGLPCLISESGSVNGGTVSHGCVSCVLRVAEERGVRDTITEGMRALCCTRCGTSSHTGERYTCPEHTPKASPMPSEARPADDHFTREAGRIVRGPNLVLSADQDVDEAIALIATALRAVAGRGPMPSKACVPVSTEVRRPISFDDGTLPGEAPVHHRSDGTPYPAGTEPVRCDAPNTALACPRCHQPPRGDGRLRICTNISPTARAVFCEYEVQPPPRCGLGYVGCREDHSAEDDVNVHRQTAPSSGAARASSACPICGANTPHPHVASEIEAWATNQVAAWGYEVRLSRLGTAKAVEVNECAGCGHERTGDLRDVAAGSRIVKRWMCDECEQRRQPKVGAP